MLALLPWIFRLGAGYFPFTRTPFDPALLLFLVTAGLGVWISYDAAGAWEKFWLIIGSIFIYYAVAGQPKIHLKWVSGAMAILGVIIALSVFFDSNLIEYTADFKIIQNQIDLWEAARPDFQVHAFSPNVSGGILAMVVPFPLLMVANSVKRGRKKSRAAALIAVVLILVALIMTSSRGAWVAAVAAGVVILLLHAGRSVICSLSRAYKIFLAASLVVIAILGVVFTIRYSMEIARFLDLLPGFSFSISRLDLLYNSWNLLADFPFTGGGLTAFPGLYSKYILHIPYLFLEYSHNLYMDIALEQGVAGWLSFMLVLFGSLFLSVAHILKNQELGSESNIKYAVIAGLIVVIVHGFIDDPFYGMQGTPLLFLLSGIGAALNKADIPLPVQLNEKVGLLKYTPLFGGVVFVILLFLVVGESFVKSVPAAWYANLGSIYMAKAELSGFPINSLEVITDEESYLPASQYFLRSLSYDPSNLTSNYRLGLIASQVGDFSIATTYLERAFQANNRHRGIRKALGYNYAWTGRPENAAELLVEIPEASQELGVYIWWWETQRQPDLAKNSRTALEFLNNQ